MAANSRSAEKAERAASEPEAAGPAKEEVKRRKISGSLPYTSSAGALKKTLESIPTIEKPGVFNADFLGTVLKITGGSARPLPPILKATGLLSSGGNPTELYSQFQTDQGRPAAALQALRNGFPEIFKRNTFAHRADEKALIDVIIAITGLPKSDQVVRYICNTFQVFQDFAKGAQDEVRPLADAAFPATMPSTAHENETKERSAGKGIGLIYNINIVLPETTNIEVYNTIFKSLKGNILS